jgi:formamidopyrimidine-DNA glycosylase
MISGRLKWSKPGAGLPGRIGLCALDFDHGSLLITEASTKKRASVHLFTDRADIERHDPGGLEISNSTVDDFANAIRGRNHTLKRALTDPRILSGIGGAYADEIMHRARLSPLKLTRALDDDQIEALFTACREVLTEWTQRLIAKSGDNWPDVTAFQPEMAVHGKFGKPCPRCGDPVQRIVYASRETNYCATCQTNGKLLADRAMSRLLRKDWPQTLDDLEELSGPEARWTPPEH